MPSVYVKMAMEAMFSGESDSFPMQRSHRPKTEASLGKRGISATPLHVKENWGEQDLISVNMARIALEQEEAEAAANARMPDHMFKWHRQLMKQECQGQGQLHKRFVRQYATGVQI